MDCLHTLFHYTIPYVENRLHACRRLSQTPLVPSFARYSTDSPVYNLVPLACGAQSGLDAVSHATQDTRDTSRRPTNSAGAYYRNALNLAKPAGKYGSITWQILWNWETGFNAEF